MMVYTAIAILGFVVALPGEVVFWTFDTVQMMRSGDVCRPADQTLSDYLLKGHWTEAPWRPVCQEQKEE